MAGDPDARVTHITPTQGHVISRDYVHPRLALEAQSVRVRALRLQTLSSTGTPTKATYLAAGSLPRIRRAFQISSASTIGAGTLTQITNPLNEGSKTPKQGPHTWRRP